MTDPKPKKDESAALKKELADTKAALEIEAARNALNEVVLAFSSKPMSGTACVYDNGTKVAQYDEKGRRAPSVPYLRAQAAKRLKYVGEGNLVVEVNLDWPMPDVLPEGVVTSFANRKPTLAGLANANYDQEVRRTDKDVD